MPKEDLTPTEALAQLAALALVGLGNCTSKKQLDIMEAVQAAVEAAQGRMTRLLDGVDLPEKADHAIIARTFSGGRDLYYGVPELLGSCVVDVVRSDDHGVYSTQLFLRRPNNALSLIEILQDK